MKAVFCSGCGRRITIDEIALNQRLLGIQIGRFFCTECLANRLDTTPDHLATLIARFKEMGCAYFTRLTEVADDAHDSM